MSTPRIEATPDDSGVTLPTTVTLREQQLEQARAVLDLTPLVDGHNDLAWELRKLDVDLPAAGSAALHDLTRANPRTHTDLPRLRRGRVGAQFWSVWVPSTITGAAAVQLTLEQIDRVHRFTASTRGTMALAWSADDVETNFNAGRMSALLGAEGAHQLGGSLAVLRMYAGLGVRYLTLTHNDNNEFADSATDVEVFGGLSPAGVELVTELNRLGMLVDLSHVSPATMHAALDVSRAPVIFSHSCARAVHDHPRNVPDDVLERVRAGGGVVMANVVPKFLRASGPASVADVVAHLEHLREVAGVASIGIGADYDGTADVPADLPDVSSYPVLFAALLERRWSPKDLIALAGGNVLRVMRDAESIAD